MSNLLYSNHSCGQLAIQYSKLSSVLGNTSYIRIVMFLYKIMLTFVYFCGKEKWVGGGFSFSIEGINLSGGSIYRGFFYCSKNLKNQDNNGSGCGQLITTTPPLLGF